MELKYLKGVGPKRAEAFYKIGINNLEDFLKFIPRMYLKKIKVKDIKLLHGDNVLVFGKIIDIDYPQKMNQPVKLYLTDGTATTEIPIFGGGEFRSKQFKLNEHFIFWGKVEESLWGNKLKIDYRDHLKVNVNDEIDKNFLKYNYIPVYELSGVLKKTWIKPLSLTKIVFNAFNTLLKSENNIIAESLPNELLQKESLISKKEAVIRINFPKEYSDIENSRKRLSFDELFYLELILALRKRNIQNETKGINFNQSQDGIIKKFGETIPFTLTNAQEKVINEIFSDMKSDKVMNRLLQGDVGSGKTIVSLFAMLLAIENNYQCAFMCPTEILAEQHYKTISNFLEQLDIKISLLVGGQKKKLREEILQDIRIGNSNIIIGTHALIQESVEFKNLGFVVIDEQHKFGVMQRAKLKEKGLNPDVLVMTATPIPRTLSLTYYGDLDISIIDELPKNRKKIITVSRDEKDKDKIFSFIKEQVKLGKQAYIIYPVIEESEKIDLKSVEENFKHLKENIFPEFKIGMIHGKMFWYEKDEIMEEFKSNKIKILVATTVIEVGIDVPNATIMVIEDAQRYGLSQLHQLRGRVGRGADQSYCILISRNLDVISRQRIEIICKTNNGFEIAEEDMKLRGPGEFFGIRQSGTLNFSCTNLNEDKDILEKAREIAFKIVEDDPHLRKKENLVIRKTFAENYKDALYLVKVA